MKHAESRERTKAIRQDYVDGMPQQEILKKYNISCLSNHIKGARRLVLVCRKITLEVKGTIIKLHNEGKNRYEISEVVKIDFRYVGQKLREWGFKPHKKPYVRLVTKKHTFNKPLTFEPRELTEGEQRIRDRYKSLTDVNDIVDYFRRNGGTQMNYGTLDPFVTVRPRGFCRYFNQFKLGDCLDRLVKP